uniref:Uncharacterized protein n=1 Tax=Onchocerca volvulus TaxID=6282 RepID=A0A8R1Y8I9_ONCVO
MVDLAVTTTENNSVFSKWFHPGCQIFNYRGEREKNSTFENEKKNDSNQFLNDKLKEKRANKKYIKAHFMRIKVLPLGTFKLPFICCYCRNFCNKCYFCHPKGIPKIPTIHNITKDKLEYALGHYFSFRDIFVYREEKKEMLFVSKKRLSVYYNMLLMNKYKLTINIFDYISLFDECSNDILSYTE